MARYLCGQCAEDLTAARKGASVEDAPVVEMRSPYAVIRHRQRWKVLVVCTNGHRNIFEGGHEDAGGGAVVSGEEA